MTPTFQERWTLFLYRIESKNWFFRWLFSCHRTFKSYRRYSKPLIIKTTVEVKNSPLPTEEYLPLPSIPERPKVVEQSKDLQDAVGKAIYGVRNPSKKLRNVKIVVNYEDGTYDSWSCEHQVGVHLDQEHGTSTITLTSLEG